MKVGIYARVSTGLQVSDGTSLDGQIELCVKKAKDLGYNKSDIEIYREEGFSGEDIDRPAINKLKEDIKNGSIQQIIITHPDRLSRNMLDKLIFCGELEQHDIELTFVDTEYKNTPEGQLFFNMQSAFAQYELAIIKKRTSRGRFNAVSKDKKIMPMGSSPYGYDFSDAQLFINEIEAEIVRLIFRWYIFDKLTLREMAKKLTEMGIPTKKGDVTWSISTIKKIICNEIYIGKFYYNRRESRKIKGAKTKSGKTKRKSKLRDTSEWVYVDVPAIIDIGTFELAIKQRKNNLKRGGNVKNEYLLKSMIRCAKCGVKWDSTYCLSRTLQNGEKKKYFRYQCRNKNPGNVGETKCSIPTVKCERLDNFIWGVIVNLINNPDQYLTKYLNSKKENSVAEKTMTTLTKQLNQFDKEKEKIKIMFRKELISEEEMTKDLEKLNASINELRNEISKFNQQLDNANKKDSVYEKLNEMADDYRELLLVKGDDLTLREKRSIIENFIDEIVIDFDGENYKVFFVGMFSIELGVTA